MTLLIRRFAVTRDEDGEGVIHKLRSPEDNYSYIDPELQRRVEEAIKRYPVSDAPQWLGGISAIKVVEDWLLENK